MMEIADIKKVITGNNKIDKKNKNSNDNIFDEIKSCPSEGDNELTV